MVLCVRLDDEKAETWRDTVPCIKIGSLDQVEEIIFVVVENSLMFAKWQAI